MGSIFPILILFSIIKVEINDYFCKRKLIKIFLCVPSLTLKFTQYFEKSFPGLENMKVGTNIIVRAL